MAGVVLLLEVLTRAGLIGRAVLPPISVALWRAAEALVDPSFLTHLLATLQATVVGLLLAIAVAVPAGIVLGSWHTAYRATSAVIEFLRPIPSVALIPLALLMFGQGLQMKVSLVAFAATWPILFNTIYGMHDVDPIAKDTARSFGFGSLSILTRVSLPSALPYVYTAVRLSAAIALMLAISAELLAGSPSGLGSWILAAGASARLDLVYAGMLVAGLLGWVMNLGLVALERRYLAWQPALRQEA